MKDDSVNRAITNAQAWVVSNDLLEESLLKGVERYIADKRINSLKKPFTVETVLLMSCGTCQVQFILLAVLVFICLIRPWREVSQLLLG